MLNPLCLQRPYNSPTERAKIVAIRKATKEAYRKYTSHHKDEAWFQEQAMEDASYWQHLND